MSITTAERKTYGLFLDEKTYFVLALTADSGIQGTITSELSLLTSLVHLDMSYNVLTGPIPSELGLLTALTDLQMHFNSLNGTIPTELGLLTTLSYVSLEYNGFHGSLDNIFCHDRISDLDLLSDCLADDPEITCSCCDVCCNATTCCAVLEGECW